jgi:hypothetical protein
MFNSNNGYSLSDIAAATGNNNNGWGLGNDGGIWMLILFIIVLMGGWNGNGWGNGNGGNGSTAYIANDVQRGFDQAAVTTGLNGISTSICNGNAALQQAMCGGFAGVNGAISNGFAQAEIAANARQMADMNQNFALQSAFQNCCCENRLGLANLGSDIAREACADRQATADAMTALSNKMDNMYNSLQMQNYQDKLDAKNERIADLQNQLTMASLSASQNAQTAQIMADNAAQTTALERYLNPTPIPAYPVQNPNCCSNRFMA